MRTIITAEAIRDAVPAVLPVTCLRKVSAGLWRMKTATDHGIKQTDYRGTDLDALERALRDFNGLEACEVGGLILCLDGESYFGLEPRLARAFPEGRTMQGAGTVVFPWSEEPKH